MPELPEVEIVCRGLANQLTGDTVTDVTVLRAESIAFPKATKLRSVLLGKKFAKFWRRGKYILGLFADGSGFALHLRMSGRLILTLPKRKHSKFLRFVIKLKSGRELRFEDMRVFGRFWFVPGNKTHQAIIPSLKLLGVEPLQNLSGDKLLELFENRKQTIKSALMDQKLIAGIGNIYADESLFQAKINPLVQAGKISQTQANCLAGEIVDVLNRAIIRGGSSIRDYTDSEGVNGRYQNEAHVYGRTKQPCRVCGHDIARTKVAGRSTHYCPVCQPLSPGKRKAPSSKRKKRTT